MTDRPDAWKPRTIAAQALGAIEPETRGVVLPVHVSTTFIRDPDNQYRTGYIYGRPDIWPHLQRMYEGYVAEPTEAANVAGWRSTYAMIAYLAGKYDVARQQLDSVQWQPRKGVSEGWGTDGSLFLLEGTLFVGNRDMPEQ